MPRSITSLLVLAAAAPLMAAAQVPLRPLSPLADSAWLRGVEWEVVPIVNLDSSKTKDPMAVRQVNRVFVLAPGRVLFEGKLAAGGDWAVFSWTDGVLKRLAVSGEEFTEPDGLKKKFHLERAISHGGPKWYAAPMAVERRLILPNAVYVTDGVAWQKVARAADTVSVSGAPMVVDHPRVIGVAHDGSVLLSMDFESPKASGVIRWSNGRFERLLMGDESLPGVGAFSPTYSLYQTFGLWSGLRQYATSGSRAMMLVRSHLGGREYQEHVIVQSGADRRLLLSTDTLTMRRPFDSVATAALSPRGDVLLQRGGTIGVVGPDAPWRPLLDKTHIGVPKFALGRPAWVDDTSSRALVPVWPMQASGGGALVALEPVYYYYDGKEAVPLQQPGTLSGVFTSIGLRDVTRRVPGYQQGIVIFDRYSPGATAKASLFDAERRVLVPTPAFRTRAGDVGLQYVEGWNSDREAVVFRGGVFLLRRPQ